MNSEDVKLEIAIILHEYQCARISFEEAFERVKAYLDSKGEVSPHLAAVAITRGWKR